METNPVCDCENVAGQKHLEGESPGPSLRFISRRRWMHRWV